jgi:hypothetical protein
MQLSFDNNLQVFQIAIFQIATIGLQQNRFSILLKIPGIGLDELECSSIHNYCPNYSVKFLLNV